MKSIRHVDEVPVAHRCDDGFSLLELVVAVSIMLILAVVGFIAYQGLTDSARQAAVEGAANEVLTGVLAAANVPNEDPVDVVYDYNDSTDDIRVNIASATAEYLEVTALDRHGTTASVTAPGDFSTVQTTAFSAPGITYEWAGAPHVSISHKLLDGAIIATNLSRNPSFELDQRHYGAAVSDIERTTEWSTSGDYGLLHTPLYTQSRGSSYIEIASHNSPRGLERGKTYTVYVDVKKPEGNIGRLGGVYMEGETVNAPYAAGEYRLRGVYTVPLEGENTLGSDSWYIRMIHRGMLGEPPMYWDSIMILEGDVEMEYFDGNSL